MRSISIIHNQYSKSDFALSLKDNYEGESAPVAPVNSAQITKLKSGMPLLQVEFWSNDKLRPYKYLGESTGVNVDDDSDFKKRDCPWSEFMEVYESWL